MEYMQYGFIALGLATIIIASLVHHKVKVKLPHSVQAVVWYCIFLTACCTVPHVVPLTDGKRSRRVSAEYALIDIKAEHYMIYLQYVFGLIWFCAMKSDPSLQSNQPRVLHCIFNYKKSILCAVCWCIFLLIRIKLWKQDPSCNKPEWTFHSISLVLFPISYCQHSHEKPKPTAC